MRAGRLLFPLCVSQAMIQPKITHSHAHRMCHTVRHQPAAQASLMGCVCACHTMQDKEPMQQHATCQRGTKLANRAAAVASDAQLLTLETSLILQVHMQLTRFSNKHCQPSTSLSRSSTKSSQDASGHSVVC